MFDSPIDLITLVIAVAAFAFARKAQEQVARLRERLETLEANGATPAARPAPPPLPQFEQAPPRCAGRCARAGSRDGPRGCATGG